MKESLMSQLGTFVPVLSTNSIPKPFCYSTKISPVYTSSKHKEEKQQPMEVQESEQSSEESFGNDDTDMQDDNDMQDDQDFQPSAPPPYESIVHDPTSPSSSQGLLASQSSRIFLVSPTFSWSMFSGFNFPGSLDIFTR